MVQRLPQRKRERPPLCQNGTLTLAAPAQIQIELFYTPSQTRQRVSPRTHNINAKFWRNWHFLQSLCYDGLKRRMVTQNKNEFRHSRSQSTTHIARRLCFPRVQFANDTWITRLPPGQLPRQLARRMRGAATAAPSSMPC